MENDPYKKAENNNEENDFEKMAAEVPSFAEHILSKEQASEPLAYGERAKDDWGARMAETITSIPEGKEFNSPEEKYHWQGERLKEYWVNDAQRELDEIKNYRMENFKKLTNPDYWRQDKEPIYANLSEDNEDDRTQFEDYKNSRMSAAQERLKDEQDLDAEELASYCRNTEIIKGIAKKINSDEDFSEAEKDFLDRVQMNNIDDPMVWTFHTQPAGFTLKTHRNLWILPAYRDLLEEGSDDKKHYCDETIVAEAKFREITRGDRIAMLANEDLQKTLENMEQRRTENPYFGETNEGRTFTIEDNYPRLNDESEESYKNRLKKISMKLRLSDKRQTK